MGGPKHMEGLRLGWRRDGKVSVRMERRWLPGKRTVPSMRRLRRVYES
jgi:hypothetical protein